MPNVTVYCKAPSAEVVPHIGDLSNYEMVEDGSDSYQEYDSLVEVWNPELSVAMSRARWVAEALAQVGIETGISVSEDPIPYVSAAAS